MSIFMTKPREVQAVQVITGESTLRFSEVPNWVLDRILATEIEYMPKDKNFVHLKDSYFRVFNQDSTAAAQIANLGDWIVLDGNKVIVVKATRFLELYAPPVIETHG